MFAEGCISEIFVSRTSPSWPCRLQGFLTCATATHKRYNMYIRTIYVYIYIRFCNIMMVLASRGGSYTAFLLVTGSRLATQKSLQHLHVWFRCTVHMRTHLYTSVRIRAVTVPVTILQTWPLRTWKEGRLGQRARPARTWVGNLSVLFWFVWKHGIKILITVPFLIDHGSTKSMKV